MVKWNAFFHDEAALKTVIVCSPGHNFHVVTEEVFNVFSLIFDHRLVCGMFYRGR